MGFFIGVVVGIIFGAIFMGSVSAGAYAKGFTDGYGEMLSESKARMDSERVCSCKDCMCDQEPKLEKF